MQPICSVKGSEDWLLLHQDAVHRMLYQGMQLTCYHLHVHGVSSRMPMDPPGGPFLSA